MADIIGIAAGLLTFGGLVGGYAYLQGLRQAAGRIERERDARALRRLPGMGGAIGGHNRPGEN